MESLDLSHGNWCNGNPRLQIKAGTYPSYRNRLKGFTDSQLAGFDAEWDAAVKAAGKEGIKTPAEIAAAKAAKKSSKK